MLKAVSDSFDLRTNRTESTRQSSVRGVLPYFLIEVLAIGSDAVLILTASILAGIVCYLLAFDSIGPVEEFVAIGFLSFVNFSAILAARAAFPAQKLGKFLEEVGGTNPLLFFVS